MLPPLPPVGRLVEELRPSLAVVPVPGRKRGGAGETVGLEGAGCPACCLPVRGTARRCDADRSTRTTRRPGAGRASATGGQQQRLVVEHERATAPARAARGVLRQGVAAVPATAVATGPALDRVGGHRPGGPDDELRARRPPARRRCPSAAAGPARRRRRVVGRRRAAGPADVGAHRGHTGRDDERLPFAGGREGHHAGAVVALSVGAPQARRTPCPRRPTRAGWCRSPRPAGRVRRGRVVGAGGEGLGSTEPSWDEKGPPSQAGTYMKKT